MNDRMPSPSPSQPPALYKLIGNTPLVEVSRLDTGLCQLFQQGRRLARVHRGIPEIKFCHCRLPCLSNFNTI